MVIERPLAPRRGGAGEIERPQPRPADSGEPTILTTFGLVRSSSRTISTPSVAMSTGGVVERREARRGSSSGSIVGRSPCTLTTMSTAPLGIERCSASWMRSEPDWWSARVITASTPALRTASATSAAVGGDRRRGRGRSRAARSATCTIIGTAGDVGQRLAGQAGRGHAGRDEDDGRHVKSGELKQRVSKVAKGLTGRRPYRCCKDQAKDLVSGQIGRPGRSKQRAAWPQGFAGQDDKGARGEWTHSNSTSGSAPSWEPCSSFFRVGIVSDAIFAAPHPEKPGFVIEAAEPEAAGGGAAAPAEEPIAVLLATADATAGAGRRARSARPAIRSRRADPTRSARISGASSTARSPSHEGFAYSGRDEGIRAGRHGGLGLRPSQPLPDVAEGPGEGHRDGLCRHQEARPSAPT